jgi:hypothetical protein
MTKAQLETDNNHQRKWKIKRRKVYAIHIIFVKTGDSSFGSYRIEVVHKSAIDTVSLTTLDCSELIGRRQSTEANRRSPQHNETSSDDR